MCEGVERAPALARAGSARCRQRRCRRCGGALRLDHESGTSERSGVGRVGGLSGGICLRATPWWRPSARYGRLRGAAASNRCSSSVRAAPHRRPTCATAAPQNRDPNGGGRREAHVRRRGVGSLIGARTAGALGRLPCAPRALPVVGPPRRRCGLCVAARAMRGGTALMR